MLPKHLVEIGCTGKASLHRMLGPEGRLEIFEANPDHLVEIHRIYQDQPNVTIYPFALWKECCTLKLHKQGASSFIHGIASPSLINDWSDPKLEDAIDVEARTFDQFDDGTIDVMDIDIEGAEWYVIQKMKSRPKHIFVEMGWKEYKNPHYRQIWDWMFVNDYLLADELGGAYCFQRAI